ncbi:MAG: FliO/MopB family protein [Candidatus Latescibacterota bacterium]|jgi:flagellar biosynthetic protein FliO
MKNIQQNRWQAAQWVVIVLVWWATTAAAEEAAVATEPVVSSGENAIQQVQEASETGDPAAAPDVSPTADSTSAPLSFTLGAEEDVEESIWGIAMRLGFGLSLVVLLAWATAFLVKKSTLGRQLGTDSGSIRVVERAYLGPKKAVILVEIGGRALALGVTETSIATLSEWEAGEIEFKPRATTPSPFAAQLKNILGQKPQEEK